MIPMSSSPVYNAHRRKQKRPLVRSNSSLLGTIKNIVTAPLAWFASTDFEDSADAKGKRRRLAPENPELSEQDETTIRKKRLRAHSPDREQEQEQLVPANGPRTYLDPPSTVFQQQYQPTNPHVVLPARSSSNPKPTIVPDFPRNASTTINLQNRSTVSPLRSALSRTMSIDPPLRPPSRESAVNSTLLPIIRDRDTSMDPFARPSISLNREKSMPPLSGRPFFRMRTSMTPQPPAPREISEPPALNTLHSNPMFIRAPQISEPHQYASGQHSTTLGSFVDSQRRTHSPIRQHSSLLFGTLNPDLDEGHRHQSPAERALHELDVYKTPLLPSRLRSSKSIDAKNILAPTTHDGPDLFKSRRASNLVLMDDDESRPNRFGRKVSNQERRDIVNDTKPYAGEGGVKRLLARRKQEVAGTGSNNNGGKLLDESAHEEIPEPRVAELLELHAPAVPPAPPKSDWYATGSSSSVTSSSLRVGRTKASRNHIARPTARPMKTKFSAAYEDDGDDAMDGGEEHGRKQEYEALETAAKQVPIFNIPFGFSFAKEDSVDRATSPVTEPPIASLPFSLTKQATTQPAVVAGKASLALTLPSASNDASFPVSPPKKDTSNTHHLQSEPDAPKTSPSFTTSIPAALTTLSGVPNFFATSSAFSKPLDIVTPAFNFAPKLLHPSKPTDLIPGASASVPDKSEGDRLLDGSHEKDEITLPEQIHTENMYDTSAVTPPPPTSSTTTIVQTRSDTTTDAQFSSVFSLHQLPRSGLVFAPRESKPPIFDAPDLAASRTAPAGDLISPALFESPRRTSATRQESPKSTSSSAPFQLGLTASAAPESKPTFTSSQPKSDLTEEPRPLFGSAVEAPRSLPGSTIKAPTPLFGATGAGFRFGDSSPEKPKEAQTIATFSFGPSPSTPPIATDKKEAMFSFGPPAGPPQATPAPFSFTGNLGTAGDVIPKPFVFGIPAATPPPPPRPATPKNQEQEFRMEESPTRELQANNNIEHTSTFSFGPNASNHAFGETQPTTTPPPFSFGGTTASNPFARDAGVKPEGSKPTFGFGQASTTAASNTTPGFSFGRNTTPTTTEPLRPSSTGSFYGATPTSATGAGPAFGFGAPSIQATASFGQPAASVPSSPSTFNQASSFTFAPSLANSFSFGSSQPASPAGGVSNLTLPQPATPVGSGSSGFGQVTPSPSSPFGPTPIASSTSSGGTLFTIGAAPASAPASGNRAIRKLPNRRGGGKR